jgi:hypothetical protein
MQTNYLIDQLSEEGDLDALRKIPYEDFINMQYTTNALYGATNNGHINILDFWYELHKNDPENIILLYKGWYFFEKYSLDESCASYKCLIWWLKLILIDKFNVRLCIFGQYKNDVFKCAIKLLDYEYLEDWSNPHNDTHRGLREIISKETRECARTLLLDNSCFNKDKLQFYVENNYIDVISKSFNNIASFYKREEYKHPININILNSLIEFLYYYFETIVSYDIAMEFHILIELIDLLPDDVYNSSEFELKLLESFNGFIHLDFFQPIINNPRALDILDKASNHGIFIRVDPMDLLFGNNELKIKKFISQNKKIFFDQRISSSHTILQCKTRKTLRNNSVPFDNLQDFYFYAIYGGFFDLLLYVQNYMAPPDPSNLYLQIFTLPVSECKKYIDWFEYSNYTFDESKEKYKIYFRHADINFFIVNLKNFLRDQINLSKIISDNQGPYENSIDNNFETVQIIIDLWLNQLVVLDQDHLSVLFLFNFKHSSIREIFEKHQVEIVMTPYVFSKVFSRMKFAEVIIYEEYLGEKIVVDQNIFSKFHINFDSATRIEKAWNFIIERVKNMDFTEVLTNSFLQLNDLKVIMKLYNDGRFNLNIEVFLNFLCSSNYTSDDKVNNIIFVLDAIGRKSEIKERIKNLFIE